jgi:hypothetical protein
MGGVAFQTIESRGETIYTHPRGLPDSGISMPARRTCTREQQVMLNRESLIFE